MQQSSGLFMKMWIFIHGCACMVLTGDYDLTKEETLDLLRYIQKLLISEDNRWNTRLIPCPRINEKFNKMSKGHKKIATFIIDHYEQAAFMTAAKLGTTVGVE